MNRDKPIFVVGLTGGIGSGKTTVADEFARRGVPIVDTDLLAREVVAPGQPGLADIVDCFGPAVLLADGSLDRAALRHRVYSDRSQRELLEGLLHPRIREAMLERISRLPGPYCIAVIPLLLETGQEALVDRILVVDVPEQEQILRVIRRDGLNRAEIEAILAAQTSRRQRRSAADDIIVNDASMPALSEQVARLDANYRMLASRH